MKPSEIYLKLLRWGIYLSLLIPLIIFSQYLSPFHFGKAVVFRSLAEILAVIYILLIVADKKYLPRQTSLVITFTIFTGFYALCSFVGVDFNYSFWGTLERMGGLFSFLHFWVFFIILISIFREKKEWEKLFKISVFVGLLSVLFAYGQRFIQGKFFIGWQHGERLIGTIGNPALFAGYLLFVLFLAIYFILKRETNFKEKGFFASVLLLGLPILHLTAVRGSILAFWGGIFLLGLIYLFSSKNRKIKTIILAGLIVFLILVVFIWLSRNQSWVKNISWLERITSISLKTSTAQTRLWSWHSGWLGFKERPILGWGPENFVLAHAKYFDPRHFTGFGAETIWDRAHNIILEMLTTMGVVGLLSYLSIFVAIYYLLIKGFKDKRVDIATFAVLGVMLIAYFMHNLFIFDTTANYYMFFLVLGYINFTTAKKEELVETMVEKTEIIKENASKKGGYNIILIFILTALALILIYKTNIEPSRANYATTRAIIAGRNGDAQGALVKYKEALSYKSPQGKYEIRHKLATFVFQIEDNLRKSNKHVNKDIFKYVADEVEKNIEDHPLDYVPYLYMGRIYIILMDQEPNAGELAENYINTAVALNPKNPRILYELGQARLSLKKLELAVEAFKRALELNPNVAESNWFLGMAYAQAGNIEEAKKYINSAIEKGYSFKDSISDIIRLINVYNEVGDYYKIIELYKLAIEEQPKNAQFYASLATAYKLIGDIENAILYARKAGEIDPKFASDSEAFINSLK